MPMNTSFDNYDSPLLGWQIEDAITSQLEDMQEQLEKQSELIAKQAALIKYYEGQLRVLKPNQFGASSEHLKQELTQLTLFEDAEIPPSPTKAEEE